MDIRGFIPGHNQTIYRLAVVWWRSPVGGGLDGGGLDGGRSADGQQTVVGRWLFSDGSNSIQNCGGNEHGTMQTSIQSGTGNPEEATLLLQGESRSMLKRKSALALQTNKKQYNPCTSISIMMHSNAAPLGQTGVNYQKQHEPTQPQLPMP